MMQAVRGEYKGSGKTVLESRSRKGGDGSAILFVIIFIIIMIIISRAARRRGYGYSRRGPFVGPFIGGWAEGAAAAGRVEEVRVAGSAGSVAEEGAADLVAEELVASSGWSYSFRERRGVNVTYKPTGCRASKPLVLREVKRQRGAQCLFALISFHSVVSRRNPAMMAKV